MAYDEELAERMREQLDGVPGVAEKRMFGGIAFLVGGNMAIAASNQGGALVRVDPASADALVDSTSAEIAIMQGRPMPGWLRVPGDDLREDSELAAWVRRGVSYAASLPPKAPKGA